MKLNKLRRFIAFALAVFSCLSMSAQVGLNDPIPVDNAVKIGKLPNGLTYYIRQNKKPEQKVELRLVINAGSIMEDDDQQGLAHMAEHMAFNGTKNFKKNEIISFLQNIGVGFGNDLNSYTSFDETVYMLPIPTDKQGNLEKGFQVLEDWAHNVTYLDEDIDAERNVILEESRLGKGANDRMFRQVYPKMFAGSKYGQRLPIGVDSIIKSFKPDAIRRFYKEWYRPNLMAVLVVGDIEPAIAESMIKKHFSGLVNPTTVRSRMSFDVPAYTMSNGIVVTDKEATNNSITLMYSAFPSKHPQTVGEYKDDILKNIFTTLLNTRLAELTQKENPPFLYGFTYFGSYARNFDQFNARIGVTKAETSKNALSVLMEEIEKAKRFGFTQSELDRAKLNMMARMEKAYNEREKTESENYIDEYIRHFLENESIPGIAKEYEYYKALVPTISIDEVNKVSTILQKTPNYLLSMMGTESSGLPEAGELVSLANSVAARTDIQPYQENVVSTTLLDKDPTPGKIIKETTDNKLGTKTWVLSNGTTVTIKKTDFKNDEILLSAKRFGGTSNYGIVDKYNAQYALSVVNAMGYGKFRPTDLQKALAGKTAGAGASLGATTDGFSGSSSVKDLETMLQLLYLKATTPRVDPSLFNSFIEKNKAQLAFIMANPQTAFVDTLMKTVYKNHPLAPIAVPHPDYFDKINMQRALDIYKERFGNANGMNFAIVGSIDEKILRPLVEKYIGGLPSSSKVKFNFKDNGVRPVNGIVDLNVNKGQEQKSLILAIINGQLPYSEALEMNMNAVSEVLNIRVIEELREKIQGIYGGGTNASLSKYPYQNYSFFVQLPTGPDKVDTLLTAMNSEIQNIASKGPSIENLDKVKKQWIESNREAMKKNGTWTSFILNSKLEKKDVDRFLNYEKYVNALTVQSVQNAAKVMFDGKNKVTGVLRPEKN